MVQLDNWHWKRMSHFAMMRPFVVLLAFLILPFCFCFQFVDESDLPGSAVSFAKYPRSWLNSATSAWLSFLSSSTPISSISMPGTHDTMAYVGGPLCETQEWSLKTQLEAGVRYLDIRNRRWGKRFTIHHGLCFLFATFEDVLKEITAFLDKNEQETIIMRVKEEFVPRFASESFQKIWNRYMDRYRKYFVGDLGSRIPTLGEVRGKIIVIREADFCCYGWKWNDNKLLRIQDYFKVYQSKSDFPRGPDTVSVDQKKNFITKYMELASNDGVGTKITLNHLSGADGMSPSSVAKRTNPHAYSVISKSTSLKRFGILIMDYPGERLIYSTIRRNFGNPSPSSLSFSRCDPLVLRTETCLSWLEIRLPDGLLGDMLEVQEGAYLVSKWFVCHRIKWSNLKFWCSEDGWKQSGSIGTDHWCLGYNSKHTLLAKGKK